MFALGKLRSNSKSTGGKKIECELTRPKDVISEGSKMEPWTEVASTPTVQNRAREPTAKFL